MESLTYIPERFAHFLFSVAEQAASDVGQFDPDKVNDQLRVAFQASQVRRKSSRHEDLKAKRRKGAKGKKGRRRGEEHPFTTTEEDEDSKADDEESLRETTAFHDTMVEYMEFDAQGNEIREKSDDNMSVDDE